MDSIKNYFKNLFKDFKFTPGFAIKCLGYLILIAYVILMAFGTLMFSPMNLFWRSLNFFGKAAEFNVILRLISYFIFFLGASWALRKVLKLIAKPLKKGKAVVDIVCSLVKYVAVLVLLFFVLRAFGVDTTAILAGIGILGLIVGLGAQPLIADILAGLFIVFEGVFDVGDIIVYSGFRGTVKEIGIRTTQILDTSGNIKIVNNSNLKEVINMTNQLSLAICDIGIEYGESLERVESILKANLPLAVFCFHSRTHSHKCLFLLGTARATPSWHLASGCSISHIALCIGQYPSTFRYAHLAFRHIFPPFPCLMPST